MVEASAPASSANLGPAFDTIALAIELRCRVSAAPADDWAVEHAGQERLPHGHRDLVLEAARLVAETPLALRVDSDIPIARGLGSSSAAAASGAAAAMRATGHHLDLEKVLAVVGELDGHWDNGAASVYGGLQAVIRPGRTQRLEWHESLRIVVAIPDESISTEAARSALADEVPMQTAIRTLSRTVALVEGVRTADPRLLKLARGDELHEISRIPLYADAAPLIASAEEAGALHSYLSGAGSAVAAIATDDTRGEVRASMQEVIGEKGRVIDADVAPHGVR